jgi:hypothetical protein
LSTIKVNNIQSRTGNAISFTSGDSVTFPSGINLGVTSPSASNLLDDYEEGTFTPTLEAINGDSSVTYSQQLGFYTKVGNLVSISIRISASVTSDGTGTSIIIGGLPFAYSGGRCGMPVGAINDCNVLAQDANANGLGGVIINDQSYIRLAYYRLTTGNGNYVAPATAGLPSYIVLGGTYQTTT